MAVRTAPEMTMISAKTNRLNRSPVRKAPVKPVARARKSG
jgi:hypothetical protein